MNYCTCAHTLNSLMQFDIDCQIVPQGPQRDARTAPWDPFQGDSTLDSGQTLDGGWRHNSIALVGAKRRLVKSIGRDFSILQLDVIGTKVTFFTQNNFWTKQRKKH